MRNISGGTEEIIAELRHRLDLTWQDLMTAVACFEIFRVAARDKTLLDRLGKSFSTGAFNAIRNSLYREVVLALMRIWDKSPKNNLRMEEIILNLTRSEVVASIKRRRREAFGDMGHNADAAEAQVEREIRQIKFIQNRIMRGSLRNAFKALEKHRNEFLAHSTLGRSSASEIRDVVYGDERYLLRWSAILSKKLNLLLDLHTSPRSDFRDFKIAAKCFWGPVRAETVEERKAARS